MAFREVLQIRGGAILVDGDVVAFTLGSKINDDTFDIHIEKALNVINYRKYQESESINGYLANNEYFKVKKIEVDGDITLNADEGSFISFTVIDGSVGINEEKCNVFDTFFLPYKSKCKISGKGTLIVTSV